MKYFIKCLKNYGDIKGRANRSEFWWFFLFVVIIYELLGLIFIIQKTDQNEHNLVLGMVLIRNIYLLAMLIPFVSVGIRRMHDVGKSGWYFLIPVYNLILAVTEGEKGNNQFGADPKTSI